MLKINNKYQMKLLASLKWGPHVLISWIKSSIQIIPYFPSDLAMVSLPYKGMRWPLTLPKPLLYNKSLTVFLLGYPKAIIGAHFFIILIEALFRRTNVQLKIYRSLNKRRIRLMSGWSLFTLFCYINYLFIFKIIKLNLIPSNS